ncbi:ABC-2 transporter permease [Blautia hansenii]|jgi:ABC-type transport system involved in multi-copper enzyme maturation permease subunit|uniref:ABC-2 transporter permease n=1 Tax=Blautia hansenii TaxID=1322 RepID=UPI0032BF7EDC
MKGLLRNNFYGMLENIKIALIGILLCGVLLWITGDSTLLSAFSLLAAPIIAVLTLSCLRKESASKWEKYKITLPVTRKDLIKSQYISHFILCVIGSVLVAFALIVTVLLHGNQYFYYGFRDAITLVLGGGIFAMLIGVIAFPLFCLWGAEKTEVISIISVLGAVGTILGLSLIVNLLVGGDSVTDLIYYISLVSILLISFITFGISYYLSCRIFKQKEF